MTAVKLLVDEHVDSTYVTALRSSGYDVVAVTEGYGPGTPDVELIDLAVAEDRLVLTNDRDFAALSRQRDHAGIVVFDQGTPVRSLVGGIELIEQYVPAESRKNQLFWLSEWTGSG